jgi:26S proteasome regulatory subunit N6
MSKTVDLLSEAQTLSKTDPKRAEQIFRDILNASGNDAVAGADDASKEQALRNQEIALVKLGELYRDQKCFIILADDSLLVLTVHSICC